MISPFIDSREKGRERDAGFHVNPLDGWLSVPTSTKISPFPRTHERERMVLGRHSLRDTFVTRKCTLSKREEPLRTFESRFHSRQSQTQNDICDFSAIVSLSMTYDHFLPPNVSNASSNLSRFACLVIVPDSDRYIHFVQPVCLLLSMLMLFDVQMFSVSLSLLISV